MTAVVDGSSPTAGPAGDLVPYPDQALFLALRGAGQAAVMQGLWIYDRPVDRDGLTRFHRNLNHGLLGRLIEPSPLPFGRHRWVAAPETDANFDVADRPRPRAELFDWADEQVALPLDPEHGPGWRLGLQQFTDGSSVVSLVASHCIADGTGTVMACVEAMHGLTRELGYPRPHAVTRGRAVRRDLRQFLSDLPEVARTLGRATRVLARRRRDLAKPAPRLPAVSAQRLAHVPSASVFLDIPAWDQRAENLGGNSFSLAAGFAGRLAMNLGRVRASDGAVTLMIPVNEREDLQNTGGNVVSIASVSLDPATVTTDLSGPRAAIKESLRTAREVPDEMVELVPLIPFVPKKAFAKIADVAFGFSTDLPVSCSNLGDMPADFLNIDGSPAQYVCFRGVDREVSQEILDRRGGLLTVAAGRIGGKVVITVISYQPGADNSQGRLREVIAATLGEFQLSGEIA